MNQNKGQSPKSQKHSQLYLFLLFTILQDLTESFRVCKILLVLT